MGKSLSYGDSDLVISQQPITGDRFVTEKIVSIGTDEYLRGDARERSDARSYSVLATGKNGKKDQNLPLVTLSENQWIRWLDHPKQCPEGTSVIAPEIDVDPAFWTKKNQPGEISLYAVQIKHHPYEFLPGLCANLKENFENYGRN